MQFPGLNSALDKKPEAEPVKLVEMSEDEKKSLLSVVRNELEATKTKYFYSIRNYFCISEAGKEDFVRNCIPWNGASAERN